MTTLDDSTALITGGSNGMGRATAERLAARGTRVALVDIDGDRLAEAASTIRAAGGTVATARLDVADAAAWREAVPALEAELGPVDHLFLFAGVGTDGTPVEDVADAVWRWIWEVNVMGTVHALRACLPGMKKRDRGGRVLITSSIGAFVPKIGMAPYSTAKHGLIGLAEGLRTELEGTSLAVSVLVPAAVATSFSASSAQLAPAELRDAESAAMFGKIGEDLRAKGLPPADVARFVLERVEAGAFYIFTHPDFRERITENVEEMLAAIPKSEPLRL